MLIIETFVTRLVAMNIAMSLRNNVSKATIKRVTLTLNLGANMRVAPHLYNNVVLCMYAPGIKSLDTQEDYKTYDKPP